jgi:hypothetical protein
MSQFGTAMQAPTNHTFWGRLETFRCAVPLLIPVPGDFRANATTSRSAGRSARAGEGRQAFRLSSFLPLFQVFDCANTQRLRVFYPDRPTQSRCGGTISWSVPGNMKPGIDRLYVEGVRPSFSMNDISR